MHYEFRVIVYQFDVSYYWYRVITMYMIKLVDEDHEPPTCVAKSKPNLRRKVKTQLASQRQKMSLTECLS